MSDMFDLSGKVALVTGGNRGIGRAIALAFAEAGAAVAILGRNEQRNSEALAELDGTGTRSMALQVDVSERTHLEPAVAEVERRLGQLDILVNNAGNGAGAGVLEVEPDEWDRILATNLTAPLFLTKYAAKSMVQRQSGKIINVASVGGILPVASPAYGGSKAALIHVTRCIAKELAPYNVQANAIAPGWVDTAMASRMKAGPNYPQALARTPAGRFANASEIAGAAVYLASPASSYVTGSVLVVDGGISMGSVY